MKKGNMMRVTDYDKSDREIYYELLRDLLKDKPHKLADYAEYVPSEIVYKALIIREFMAKRGISDIHQGVRRFVAFERDRLQRLNFM